jgi:DNA-directed RNA polymerase subunit RPC12/RpoP
MPPTTYLKITCERCGGHIEYPSEMAGQSIQCSHCQHTIKLLSPHRRRSRRQQYLSPHQSKRALKARRALRVSDALFKVSAWSVLFWLSPLSRPGLALLSLESLVFGFCSTVAGRLRGLSVRRAAVSYRTSASVSVRTVIRVFTNRWSSRS